MNKIGVFGGGGFVGGEFCRTYLDEVEVVGRKINATNYPVVLDFVSTVDNYNVHTNPFLDIDTNLRLLVEKLQNTKIIYGTSAVYNFMSSWFVYGKTKLPAKEDSPCNPTGFYSITKRAAEQLLISYCQTFGMKWRILRLGNVIGVGDKKISPKKNALQWMIKELAQGRDISLYENSSLRDYIDVRDVVSAIHLVLEKGEPNQIYNIANGRGYNVDYLIKHAHEACGFTGKIGSIPVPEFHKIVQTPMMYMDISKIKRLGYIQQYDIMQSVASLAEYYQKNEA